MWNKFIDDWKTPVEYIDREAANLALAEQGFDWDKAKQALASVLAADVVPVVRCRDCRKRGLPECPMETEYPWIDADSDGFCNQGVKKKGEEHNND